MKPNFPTQFLRRVRRPLFNSVQPQFPRWRRIVEKSLALLVVVALLLGVLPPATYAAPLNQPALLSQPVSTVGACTAPNRGATGANTLFLPLVAQAKTSLGALVGADVPAATNAAAVTTSRTFNYQVGKVYTYLYDYVIETHNNSFDKENGQRATGSMTRINAYADLTVLSKAADGAIEAQLALRDPFLCITADQGEPIVSDDANLLAQLATPIRFTQAANGVVLAVTSQPAITSTVTNLQKGVINFLQTTLRSDSNDYIAQEAGGQGQYNVHYQLADTAAGLAITKTISTADFQQLITAGDKSGSLQLNTQLTMLLGAQNQVLETVTLTEDHKSNDNTQTPGNSPNSGGAGLSVWSTFQSSGSLRLQSVSAAPTEALVEAAGQAAIYALDSLGAELDGVSLNGKQIDLATVDLDKVLADFEAASDKTQLFLYLVELHHADTGTVVVDKIGQRLPQVINDEKLAKRYIDLLGAIGTPQAQAYLNGLFNNAPIAAANVAASTSLTTQQQALINMSTLVQPITTTINTLQQIGYDKRAPLSSVASRALGGLVEQFGQNNPALASEVITHYENDLHTVKTIEDALVCLQTLGNIGNASSLPQIKPFLGDQITIDGKLLTNGDDIQRLNMAAYTALRRIPGQEAEDLLLAALQNANWPLWQRNIIAELLLNRQLDKAVGLSAAAAAVLNSYIAAHLASWDDAYDPTENNPLVGATATAPTVGQQTDADFARDWNKELGNADVGLRALGSIYAATPPESNGFGGGLYVRASQRIDAHVWEALPEMNVVSANAEARFNGSSGYDITAKVSLAGDEVLNKQFFLSCTQEIGPFTLFDFTVIPFYRKQIIFPGFGLVAISASFTVGAQLFLDLDAGAKDLCGSGTRTLRLRLTPGVSLAMIAEGSAEVVLYRGVVELRGDLFKTKFPIQGTLQYQPNNRNKRWCLDVKVILEPFNFRFYTAVQTRSIFPPGWKSFQEWLIADFKLATLETAPLLVYCQGTLGGQYKTGDFDGDGKADIAIFRPANNTWYWLESSTGTMRTFNWGEAGDQIAPGDYDGDGKLDATIFRPRTGEWWLSQTSDGVKTVPFGQADDIPVARDYDGDGRTDIAVWRPSNRTAYWPEPSVTGAPAYQWGEAGDIPVFADYDGDKRADSAVYRPSSGQWWLSQTRDGLKVVQWGQAGDIPLARDYDGDGNADIAIWRPGDGTWWIIKSSDGAIQTTQWGLSRDIPAPADFDGDGKADLTVVRNFGLFRWYIQRSSDGQEQEVTFGEAGDVPVP
jgi:hypothetical protein